MSRDLPAHPNLDHLKKQAKVLLRELRLRNPDSKLADAQHALAREYGFASWPKLRARVVGVAHPLVGNWAANLAKSMRHPDHQFQSATLQFTVAGDMVTITDVVVDASGEAERKHTVQADGEEHPAEGNPRYAVVAKWRGSNILEAVGTRDGQFEGRVLYEVSADGKTLTVSAGASGADFEQVIVFDRT